MRSDDFQYDIFVISKKIVDELRAAKTLREIIFTNQLHEHRFIDSPYLRTTDRHLDNFASFINSSQTNNAKQLYDQFLFAPNKLRLPDPSVYYDKVMPISSWSPKGVQELWKLIEDFDETKFYDYLNNRKAQNRPRFLAFGDDLESLRYYYHQWREIIRSAASTDHTGIVIHSSRPDVPTPPNVR